MGKEHRVPTFETRYQACKALLGEQQIRFLPFEHKALSENAMLALLKRMKTSGITVHDFATGQLSKPKRS